MIHVQPDNAPLGDKPTHSLVRTSPKGPGNKFIGRCIYCGLDNLPIEAVQWKCLVSSPDQGTRLLEAIT